MFYLGLFLASIPFLGAVGCQSTGGISRVDKDRQNFELESQDDTRSAMPTAKDSATEALIESLSEELKAGKGSITTHLNLAQAYLAKGKFDTAEVSCRNALKMDLKNETAKRILAQIYYRRGNYDMAKIILENSEEVSYKESQTLNLIGLIAIKQNRPEFALHNFKEALKINPSDISVRMNLGVLYLQYRQIQQASVEFERVIKLMPHHADAALHLAIIEANRGDLTKAEELYKRAMKGSPHNPIIMFNLAVLEEKRKNFDQSLAYLRKYLQTDYAKKNNNQEVFALIDKIKGDKEASSGSGVSDDEILKLAAKKASLADGAEDQPATNKTGAESKQTVEMNGENRPQSEVSEDHQYEPAKYKSEDEEIKDLENRIK